MAHPMAALLEFLDEELDQMETSRQEPAKTKSKSARQNLFEAIFLTASGSDWTPGDEEDDTEDEAEEEAEEQEHVSEVGEFNAILWKDHKYSKNFYMDASGNGARNIIYHDFPHTSRAYPPTLADFFKAEFKFPGGNECNFNPNAKPKSGSLLIAPRKRGGTDAVDKAGQAYPYKWEAHHMIPGEAFYGENENGERVFTGTQYLLAMQSDYDINNGKNMIALPTNGQGWAQPVHSLIQHPSNHPKWTQKVMGEMKDIARELQKLEDNDAPHPDIAVKIKEDLMTLQGELWDDLVELSRDVIEAALTNQRAGVNDPDGLVKWQAENDTQYKFGALG